jgi:hypothetical protein
MRMEAVRSSEQYNVAGGRVKYPIEDWQKDVGSTPISATISATDGQIPKL